MNFQVLKTQTLALASANLKSRYRNTFSGFFWVVFNPILMFGAQAFAFHFILRLNVDRFPLFLLSGLIPWLFVVQTLDMGTNALVTHGRLLKSFPIHPAVPLASQVIENLLNFVVAFMILLVPVGILTGLHWESFLLLPLAMVILMVGTFSMLWWLSVLNVFYQDTRFVVSFLASVTFFMTPIFYPEGFVPENLQWIFLINPFYHLISPFRYAVLLPFSPIFWERTLVSIVVVVGMFTLAYLYWRKKSSDIYFRF